MIIEIKMENGSFLKMFQESSPQNSILIRKRHKRKIKRTLLHLSFVYFFTFTSFNSLEVIQSSLNFEEGLGTLSLSILYAAFCISCISIGPIAVSIINPKWTLLIGCVVHTLYVLTNIWPLWSTLVSASVALGIVSSFIWITQGIYVTNLALEYSRHSKYSYDIIISNFVSIFFFIFGFCGTTGSVISSIVLSQDENHSDNQMEELPITSENPLFQTVSDHFNFSSDSQDNICGANHCPYMETHSGMMKRPSQTVVYIFVGIFLAFDVIGVVLCIFLPNVPNSQVIPVKTKLHNIFTICKSKDLMLMIPMYYFRGLYSAVFFGSFTLSFITCSYGIAYVGYTMIAEALSLVAVSLLSSHLAKVQSRPVQMALLICLLLGEVMFWLLWSPHKDGLWILFVIVIISGIARGMLKIQSYALTSLLFAQCPEAAFGQSSIWNSLGYITGFTISSKVCFFIKSYIILGCIGAVAVTYIFIEIRLMQEKKEEFSSVRQKDEHDMSSTS